jgi:hypothetical protein
MSKSMVSRLWLCLAILVPLGVDRVQAQTCVAGDHCQDPVCHSAYLVVHCYFCRPMRSDASCTCLAPNCTAVLTGTCLYGVCADPHRVADGYGPCIWREAPPNTSQATLALKPAIRILPIPQKTILGLSPRSGPNGS